MAIKYQKEDVPVPPIKRRIVTKWIKEVALSYDKIIGNVSYIFCSDEKILEINKKYLQHDYYTDIITFDYSDEKVISGDIFISIDTVKSNSEQFGTTYSDELHRVIIHGVLHLCGINDKSADEQNVMTKCENEALSLLNEIIR